MKKLCVRKPLAALISITLATSAFADSQPNKTFSLDTVSVAATRTEQKQGDVAASVNIITDEQNEANLSSNIRDMIRYEPGISVGDTNSRFGSKDFNIRGIDDNRVKITVDGIDQAKSFSPNGSPFQRTSSTQVDIDTVKRVEILKGPASTLYGSDALGGVVAFTTKNPADYLEEGDNTGGSVKLRYGSADESFSQTVSLANRTGSLESLLVYTHRESDELENYDKDARGDDSIDFDSDNILAKLQYQINDNHRVGLTVEDYKSNFKNDLPSFLSSSFYSEYYFGDDKTDRERVSVFHQWQANNALFDKVDWDITWQNSESEQATHTIFDSPGPAPAIARIKDYAYEEETWILTAQFDKTIHNHQLTYGFEYEETEMTNQKDTVYPTDPASDDINRSTPLVDGTSYGLYLQDQISFLDERFLLTPGVRYDNFEAEPNTDSSFSPSGSFTAEDYKDHDSDKVTAHLGAVFKFNDTASIFAQYSQGFKSPDLASLYFTTVVSHGSSYIFLPNSDLDPEESDSYELGLRFKGDAGNLELTGFYNEYTDFIQYSQVGTVHDSVSYSGGVHQAQNLDDVTIWGLEARGAIWLDQTIGAPEGTSLQGAIAYAKGESEGQNGGKDIPLDTIAPLKAVFGLSYEAPSERWGTTLNWTLVSDKSKNDLSDEDNETTSGYGILDITGFYNPIKSLTIRGGVFNLTDKEYVIYDDVRGLDLSSSVYDIDAYTQPGRNFSISATYSF